MPYFTGLSTVYHQFSDSARTELVAKSILTDETLNIRDLEVGPPGEAPITKHESEFIIGLYAPTTKPGTCDLYISVGTRDGTPTTALPLKDDDGQRRYRLGPIILQED